MLFSLTKRYNKTLVIVLMFLYALICVFFSNFPPSIQFLVNYFESDIPLETSWTLVPKMATNQKKILSLSISFFDGKKWSAGACNSSITGVYSISENKLVINKILNRPISTLLPCDINRQSYTFYKEFRDSSVTSFQYVIHGHTLTLRGKEGAKFYFIAEDDYKEEQKFLHEFVLLPFVPIADFLHWWKTHY